MFSVLRQISELLARWYIALAACFALGAVVLLPGLGVPGLWEPQERALSDRVAPPIAVEAERSAAKQKAPPPPQPAKPTTCQRTPPDEPVARSLSTRATKIGRDLADSDAGRRFPFAVLGLIALLATAGIAIRTAGARAGIVTAIILSSMPLFVLQARMLTSEIGTACGAALIVYGLLALRHVRDVLRGGRAAVIGALDSFVGLCALGAGVVVGFVSGGALLGLLVPLGAYAAAGMLGAPTVVDGLRLARNTALAIGRRVAPRWAAGRERSVYTGAGTGPALIAALVAAGLVALLAYQLYRIEEPIVVAGQIPPARQVLGHAILPDGCWSWALGALWRPEDDLRFIHDSTFELIAFGTFPWGLLGPIAAFALLRDPDRERRLIGALALAWAGGAWIATEAFQRKVGFTIWAGFPALAIAIGVWLDGALTRRKETGAAGVVPAAGAVLLGLFVLLAVLDLAKDLQSFPDKLTSLLVGSDAIAYPKQSAVSDLELPRLAPGIGCVVSLGWILAAQLVPAIRARRAARLNLTRLGCVLLAANISLLGMSLSTKRWVLVLGVIIALAFAIAMMVWRRGDDRLSRLARRVAAGGAVVALATSVATAAFWSFVWQPRIAIHLSSKALFETFKDLRAGNDQIVIMGDLGQAPRSYANATTEQVQTREQIVGALKRPNRVFAIAPLTEICAIHREIGDKPYFVVDDRNSRNLLLSNKVDGTVDKNPLRDLIAHVEPKGIKSRPKARIVWENKIELLGWEIPARVQRGESFEMVLYYKILNPVGSNWTTIVHIDGPIRVPGGDHKPIKDRCPTSTWQQGDYIIDRHTMSAGGGAHPRGRYEIWTGFFTGTAPNFRNMPLSEAPGDMRDTTDRVRITTLEIQ